MRPGEFFRDEEDFQKWVVKEIESYGGHTQSLTGDDKYPGIPDLTMAIEQREIWAEVKLYRKNHEVHSTVADMVKGGRELTAQQRDWLRRRWYVGNSVCGVLFAWKTANECRHVSFIPIQEWVPILNSWSLAALILSNYTDTLDRFISGKSKVHTLFARKFEHSWVTPGARNAGHP